jgi:hypothetical protein
MQLTDENIAEFQMLYKKHYGKEISKEVALDKGLRLIRYMKVVLQEYAKIEAEENEKVKSNETDQRIITN